MDQKQLKHLLVLARLHLDEKEAIDFSDHFSKLISHLEVINTAKVAENQDRLEYISSPPITEEAMRDDVSMDTVNKKLVPGAYFSSRYYQVPVVVDDE